MKKSISCFFAALILSLSFLSACNFFDSDTLFDESENENNDLSQYYIENCPMTFDEKTVIVSESNYLQLIFINSTDKKIIAYEAVFILYNVYGEALKYSWNNSIYNKLAETPSAFYPEHQDIQYVDITDKVYSAEIYIYFTLFEDQTTWGKRTDITIDDICKLCPCKKVVKK